MDTSIFDDFRKTSIIPVLEIDHTENAVPVAEALLAGGLPIAEITLRTEAALGSIRAIAQKVPEILRGAGTVLNREQAEAARDAGAQFTVSPGMAEEVIIWAQTHRIPILPGAITPSGMIRGISLGLSILKFFPAVRPAPIAMLPMRTAAEERFPEASLEPRRQGFPGQPGTFSLRNGLRLDATSI